VLTLEKTLVSFKGYGV